jgi:glycosyltransferase involved in cell wall biosynthesis
MVGRLAPEKDWITFLKVTKDVQEKYDRDCCFLIVGAGASERSLHNYIETHHIDNVRFLGYRNDVVGILSQSDIFLLTSKREPFGLVVLEAMAADCPVISTRSGGPDTIITDGYDGILCDVGDVVALSQQVRNILTDEDYANYLSKNAQKTVREKFDVKMTMRRLAEIYNTILSE